jgi:hypothetical protein
VDPSGEFNIVVAAGLVATVAIIASISYATFGREDLTVYHGVMSQAGVERITRRVIANLDRGGFGISTFELRGETSGFGNMFLLYWPGFLVELRDGRDGSPTLREGDVGHMFAQLFQDHAGVDTSVIRNRAGGGSGSSAEERFVIGVANVMTHEIGHRYLSHTDTHDFMKAGGAAEDDWLFDPSLNWPESE